MKIVSRSLQDDGGASTPTVVMGTGQNQLLLSHEQLELISALVYQCRLGTGSAYATAAFEILDMIESTKGSDFMEDAADNVDLQVTIEDDQGFVVMSTKSGNYLATLEV